MELPLVEFGIAVAQRISSTFEIGRVSGDVIAIAYYYQRLSGPMGVSFQYCFFPIHGQQLANGNRPDRMHGQRSPESHFVLWKND